MDRFVPSLVLIIFFLGLFIPGIYILRDVRYFSANKIKAKAEVVGYTSSGEASRCVLLVELFEVDPGSKHNCKTSEISAVDFPVGTVINVEYAEKSLFGKTYYDIKINDGAHEPFNPEKLGKIFTFVSVPLLIFAIVLFIMKLFI